MPPTPEHSPHRAACTGTRRRRAPDSECAAGELFLGRERELAAVARATRHVRLVLIYGPGGVGKSTFLRHAGEALALRARARLVTHRCGPRTTTAALARLAAPAADRGASAPSPLVVCLDDAQRAAGLALLTAVRALLQPGRPLWVVVASRTALAFDPRSVDHLRLTLGGLAPAAATALHRELCALYGAPPRPLASHPRATVSPLALREAFVEDRPAADPLGLSTLGPEAGEALRQLCAYRLPVPPGALHVLAGPVARLLGTLRRHFLVERTSGGEWTVSDVVRAAVTAHALRPGPDTHALCLEWYAHRRDEVSEVERLHHAVAAGRVADVEASLRRSATGEGRVWPTGRRLEAAMTAGLALVAHGRELTADEHLLQARILIRRGGAQAGDLLAAAVDPARQPLATLARAEAASLAGGGDQALRCALSAARDEHLSLTARLWASVLALQVALTCGQRALGAQVLAASAELFSAAGPAAATLRHWMEGVVHYDAERYREAMMAFSASVTTAAAPGADRFAVPLAARYLRVAATADGRSAEAGPRVELGDESLVTRLLARLLRAHVLCWRGDLRRARQGVRRVARVVARGGLHSLRVWAACLEAEIGLAQGRPMAAAARLQRRLGVELGGAGGFAPFIPLLRGRSALALGDLAAASTEASAAEACAEVPGTRARARALHAVCRAIEGDREGALALVDEVGAAQGIDRAEWCLGRLEVLAWGGDFERVSQEGRVLVADAQAAGWSLVAGRARLLLAEAAAHAGDWAGLECLWASARADAARVAALGDLARADLIGALIARVRGDAAREIGHLEAARGRAGRLGLRLETDAADAVLAARRGAVPQVGCAGLRLASRLTLLAPLAWRLRTEVDERWLSDPLAEGVRDPGGDAFVDAKRATVRIGARRVTLERSPGKLALLLALAAATGEVVPVDQLTRRAWGHDYHPQRHRARLGVALSRLRATFGSGVISGTETGYRLSLGRTWTALLPAPRDR